MKAKQLSEISSEITLQLKSLKHEYKLIKYIELYKKNSANFNQVFITTHSSNITASANLDDIILVDYKCDSQEQNVKCINLKDNFNSDLIKEKFNIEIKQDDLTNYKKHLHKFLDVTRSDLLFADSVILVEGLSEKIFIPHAYEKEYKNIDELYVNSRTEGFNFLTKAVILYGSDVLSKNRYKDCFDKSLRVRRVVAEGVAKTFKEFDAVLTPVCSATEYEAYDIKSAFGKVFAESVFTAVPNLIGVPALVTNGAQLIGNHFQESTLLSLAHSVEKEGK